MEVKMLDMMIIVALRNNGGFKSYKLGDSVKEAVR